MARLPHRPFFTRRRIKLTALALAPVLLGGSSIGDFSCSFGDGNPHFLVELTSLNSKRIPISLEDDGNLKDVKLKDRAAFKPSKGTQSGIAKRLRMKSKVDGGAACYLSENEVAGNVSAQVRVAFDSTDGLIDGKSQAFLERRPMGLPAGPLVRLTAAYDAVNDGLAVTFLADGEPVGETITIPGAHDIHLILLDTGSLLTGRVAEATGEDPIDVGSVEELGSIDTDAEDTNTVVALGVEALGKKGAFWFDQFILTFDANATDGDVETPVFQTIGASLFFLKAGLDYLDNGGKDIVTLLDYIGPPILPLNDSWDDLDAGQEQGQLQPTTDSGLVTSSIEGALIQLVAAQGKLLAAFDNGATDGSFVAKQMSKAADKLELALAQLAGFHSKSKKQLEKSVKVTYE